MAKANKQIIIDEIVVEIAKGISTEKICSAICTKFQFTERTFYNHFKIAQQQHTERQQGIKEAIAKDRTIKELNAVKSSILTAIERKELLTKIALGLEDVEETTDSPNGTITFKRKPNPSERIKAINEINKMEGDYAPQKQQTELTVTQPVIIDWVGNDNNTNE
jgi:hypothetical protein